MKCRAPHIEGAGVGRAGSGEPGRSRQRLDETGRQEGGLPGPTLDTSTITGEDTGRKLGRRVATCSTRIQSLPRGANGPRSKTRDLGQRNQSNAFKDRLLNLVK